MAAATTNTKDWDWGARGNGLEGNVRGAIGNWWSQWSAAKQPVGTKASGTWENLKNETRTWSVGGTWERMTWRRETPVFYRARPQARSPTKPWRNNLALQSNFRAELCDDACIRSLSLDRRDEFDVKFALLWTAGMCLDDGCWWVPSWVPVVVVVVVVVEEPNSSCSCCTCLAPGFRSRPSETSSMLTSKHGSDLRPAGEFFFSYPRAPSPRLFAAVLQFLGFGGGNGVCEFFFVFCFVCSVFPSRFSAL
jgi:hypothetical protein